MKRVKCSESCAGGFVCFSKQYANYLENSDNGPEQGVKVLSIWYCVACLCL